MTLATGSGQSAFTPGVFTQGFKDNDRNDPWVYFTSNNPDYIVLWNEDGTEGRFGKGLILAYDANGGKGTKLEGHFPLGDEDTAVTGTIAENKYTRSGYEFTGGTLKLTAPAPHTRQGIRLSSQRISGFTRSGKRFPSRSLNRNRL